MNTLDLFIFIPVALGLIFGLFRGFVKEVISLLAVVLALLAAEMFSPLFSGITGKLLDLSDKTANTVTYVLTFIITIITALLFFKLAEKLLSNISLGWLNSILGGFFGALKYAIIVSLFMNVFEALDSKFEFAKPETKTASVGYYPILKLAPFMWKQSKEVYNKNKREDEQSIQSDKNN